MSKPHTYHTHKLQDTQWTDALQRVLCRYLSLELRQTRLTKREVFTWLSYAAVNHTSLETVANELAGTASGNRLREVIKVGLPARAKLQRQLNTILGQQLPPSVRQGKYAYELAADLTLIPYHGAAASEPAEIMHSAAKAGTTHFHGYATVSIVHHQHRYVLALTFITAGEKMVTVLRRLLDRVRKLGVCVQCVLLDKGFYAGEVFRLLERRRLSYIVPLRLGQSHTLFHRRGSYRTRYTIRHARGGAYTVRALIVRRFKRTRRGRRKVWWLGFACGGWTQRLSLHQVTDRYRRRFGIETSYRQMNQVRARTTSRNPVLRLLYIGLALILVNWYVGLRRRLAQRQSQKTSESRPRFSLQRLCFKLRREIERCFGVRQNLNAQVISLS